MAKKTESKPKEPETVPVTPENADVTPGTAAGGQEAVQEKEKPAAEAQEAVQEKEEPAAEAREDTPEKQEPEQAAGSMMVKLEEILNNDIKPTEGNTPQENDDQQDTEPPQEKILFYVKTVNDKTAIRSTPEHPMSGAGNITGMITDREPYGIAEVANGFGRIAGGTGWIMLDPGVVIRQE